MNDLEYYKQLMEVLDEAVKNSINNTADIGRLNEILIETAKRLRKSIKSIK